MRALCVLNDPTKLADHQQDAVTLTETVYSITVGKEYGVVGMMIFRTKFLFLVEDDWGTPSFVYAGFFEPFSAPFPAGWAFALMSGVSASGRDLWEDPYVAVWGYPELLDTEHIRVLQEENDSPALAVFREQIAKC